MVFCGTVPEAEAYLNRLEPYISVGVYPVDYLISIAQQRYEDDGKEFVNTFVDDPLYTQLIATIENRTSETCSSDSTATHEVNLLVNKYSEGPGNPANNPEKNSKISIDFISGYSAFRRRFVMLTWRNVLIAFRDLAIFPMQFILESSFGVVVGLLYFKVTWEIGKAEFLLLAAVSFTCNLMTYMMLFRVLPRFEHHARCKAESSPYSYSKFCFWFSDICASMLDLLAVLPAVIVPFFMVGLPASPLPFLVMLFYVVSTTVCHAAMK